MWLLTKAVVINDTHADLLDRSAFHARPTNHMASTLEEYDLILAILQISISIG